MKHSQIIAFYIGAVVLNNVSAETKVEVETTRIRGTQELPKVLYVVPWKDKKAIAEKGSKSSPDQKLVLHDLLGDLYDPQLASDWKQ
jgi:hypothetical protein